MVTNTKIRISAEDKTKRAFQSINNSMKGMSGGVFSLRSNILSLVGVGGMGALIKSSIDAADSIAKTADKLGITTDALQEYRFAAERTGVKQTALDMGVQRFTRRLAEADKGTGELTKTLNELGISTRDNEGKIRTTEDVLKQYANAIQDAESEQEQLRLAFKAFDSEGAAMVNMLRHGADGLEDLRGQARGAGVVMDEALIRKAEIANDRWETLAETISVKFKSAVLSITDAMFDLREESVQLTHNITVLEREIKQLEEHGGVDSPFTKWFGTTTKEKVAAIKKEIAETKERLQEIANIKTAKIDSKIQGSEAAPDTSQEDQQKAAERLLREEENDRKRLAAKFDRLNHSLLSEQERLKRDLEEKEFLIEESFQQGLATETERTDALFAINEEYENKIDALKDEHGASRLEREQENANMWDMIWANSINNFSSGVGNAVADVMVDAKSRSEALRALMKNVSKQVISSLTEISVKRTIMALTAQAQEKAVVLSGVASAAALSTAYAPAAAAASLASFGGNSAPAMAGISATHALSKSLAIAGQAHDGLDNVPREGTYLLQKGEMVLDPGTSKQVRENVTNNESNNKNIVNELNVTVIANDAASFSEQNRRDSGNIWNIIMDRMHEEGLSFS